MIFYHYAITQYPILKTLKKRVSEGEKIKLHKDIRSVDTPLNKWSPGGYGDHISFFHEKVPLTKIARYLKNRHHFWKSGAVLFEHSVEVKSEHLPFEVLEHPDKTKLYYDGAINITQYHELMEKLVATKLVGYDMNKLNRTIKELTGTVDHYYSLIQSRPNFDEIIDKYAATVPHIALYPELGEIKVDSIKQVKVS